jgi:hypothetical protein
MHPHAKSWRLPAWRPSHLRRWGLVAAAAATSVLTIAVDPGIASAHLHRASGAAAATHRHASVRHVRAHGDHATRGVHASTAMRAAKPRPAAGPPTCSLSLVNNRGHGHVRVFGRDATSGIESVEVLKEVNDPVNVPSFTPGTVNRVVLFLRKQSANEPSVVTLRFTNVAGASTTCTFTFFRVAPGHFQTIGGISRDDHTMMIGDYGLRSMVMRVNSHVNIVRLGQTTRTANLTGRFGRNANSIAFWGARDDHRVKGTGDAFVVIWNGSVGRGAA